MPSICYLIKNKTVAGYNGQNYFFIGNDGKYATIVGALIWIFIVTCMFIVYLKLIKNSDKFKKKWIIFSALLVGIAFLICLPNTSEDLFYYMGSGRVLSYYGENPYYTTVLDLLKNNPGDEILASSGVWSGITVVYGPVWVIITNLLNKLSFNSVTILMCVFKIANLIVHLGIVWLLYKLTNKKKMAIAYAFNPLIILEFIVNSHNDVYMIFFIMLAIYFIKNKKNLILRISLIDFICNDKICCNIDITIFTFVLF